MVHEYYIKRGAKKFGPYYYESYREGNKVKKRYLGDKKQYEEDLKNKKPEINTNINVPKTPIINQDIQDEKNFNFLPLFLIIGIIFLFAVIFFVTPAITGFAIQNKENAVQLHAEINQPVKWQINAESNSVKIPSYAVNVKINGENAKVKQDNSFFGIIKKAVSITGFAVQEKQNVIVDSKEAIISYETPAPKTKEKEFSRYKKKVIVSSDIHYENILAYAKIHEITDDKSIIKIYDAENNLVENVEYIDENNNGLIDKIQWTVPHLSEQEYIIVIEIGSAQHLDENKIYVEDVYDYVKTRDNIFKEISNNEYIRVTFQQNLTPDRDITIYAKSESNGTVEVYEKDSNIKLADFGLINEDKKYKIFLTNLTSNQDTFDLKVLGNVEFDYIVDPGETYGLLVFFNETSIPQDWTCVSCLASDPFYARFPRGEETYGGLGGNETHIHLATSAMSDASTAPGSVSTATGSVATEHTHPTAITVNLSNSIPPYKNLKVIRYNNGVPTMLPRGAIAVFNATVPSVNWTQYSVQNNLFARANNDLNAGGNSTHHHNVSLVLSTATATNYKTASTIIVASSAHIHKIGSTKTNQFANIPPYTAVIFGCTTANTTIPDGLIAMFNATVNGNWIAMSNSTAGYNALYQKFLNGSATYGATGGNENSTHDNIGNLTTDLSSANLTNGKTAGTAVAGGDHTHKINITYTTNVSLPPYINVILGYYKKPSVSWNQSILNIDSTGQGLSKTSNATVTSAGSSTSVAITELEGNGTAFISAIPASIGSMSNLQTQEVMFNCSPPGAQAFGYYESIYNVNSAENQTGNNITIGCVVGSADSLAPQWSSILTNASAATKYSYSVYFNTTFTEDNPDTYIFSTNQTGTWINYTGTYTTGVSITNITNITATRGKVVGWYFWANDTLGQQNQTGLQNFTIANTAPTTITLTTPVTDNTTENRTPTFTWASSYDADGDAITYTLMINCSDNGAHCTLDDREITGLTSAIYTPNDNLKLFGDDNYYYNWSVLATDTYANTSWTAENKMTVNSLVSLTLPTDNINFGNINLNQELNTTNPSYPPLVIQNDGNCYLDLNISLYSDLWITQSAPSTYFRYKVDNVTGEEGAYNVTDTQTTWANIPTANITFIDSLNYSISKDSAEIDILLKVPSEEPSGKRNATIVFTGWYNESIWE